jgi:hypothetical protein
VRSSGALDVGIVNGDESPFTTGEVHDDLLPFTVRDL